MTPYFQNLDAVLYSSPESGPEKAAAAKSTNKCFSKVPELTEEINEKVSDATTHQPMSLRLLSIFAILVFFVLVNWEIPMSSIEQDTNDNDRDSVNCSLPENPYYPGSGEYDGFEWAEQGRATSCISGGLFRTGCEEYRRQLAAFDKCSTEKR